MDYMKKLLYFYDMFQNSATFTVKCENSWSFFHKLFVTALRRQESKELSSYEKEIV